MNNGVDLDQRFSDALSAHNLVFVCGTGVSAALSGNAGHATWSGLIDSGIELAVSLGAPAAWEGTVRQNLEYGFASGESAVILAAASMVSAQLQHFGDHVMSKWLEETVGQLKVTNADLSEVFNGLPFPLLTTNYDRLLEAGGRQSVNWLDASAMQGALVAGDTIGHLHGVWNVPRSIIFTAESYQELLAHDSAQSVQQAASTLKSLVYVGYGAGLDDPNFSQLIKWHRAKFVPSAVPHFRLCLDSELASVASAHANDHVIPIVYGIEHSDLAGFLRDCTTRLGQVTLTDTGAARDWVAEARFSLADELKRDSIIVESRDDQTTLLIEEAILPPVLLPVPHADYVKSRLSKDPASRVDRLDPVHEVRGHDVLILASEEGNGLTTALKWLALEAANYLGSAVPLYVSFQKCRAVAKPLEEQVRREAMLRGAVGGRRDPLPTHVLALDDFSPFVDRVSDRVIRELAESTAILTIIGCKQGVEEELVDRLTQVGRKPVVRYLGRLAAEDVRRLARLAWPSDAERLAVQVLGVLESENLPRTPYTVGLLISVLIQGGTLARNSSQTSILDDYVGLMLGRGDPHDDARFGLDQAGREAVLAGFAEQLVDGITGGLTEAETIAAFQAVFDRFAWPDSPTDLLGYFLERHLLRKEAGHILFARSSYLHLFAAKRAMADDGFRAKLVERPLFFASAITDYAALYRHDGAMVSQLAQLLEEKPWTINASSIFDEVSTSESVPIVQTEETSSSTELGTYDTGDHYFDTHLDLDTPPFPVSDEVDVPNSIQLMRVLDLVSTVLRDSDQVEDLAMKGDVLVRTLQGWGELMTVIHQDKAFQDLLRTLFDEFGGETDDEKLDELAKSLPAAMALAGVSYTLASRKLTVVLRNVLESSRPSDEVVVSAAFFIYALRDAGWVRQLAELVSHSRPIWVIRNFLMHLLIKAFVEDEAPTEERDDLLDLCAEIWQGSQSYDNRAAQLRDRESLRKFWTAERLKRRTRKLTADNATVVAEG